MTETYTDKCGKVIDRRTAIDDAVRTIMRQGDAHPIVREYVEHLPDAELMVWLVDPDTGEFDDYLHRCPACAFKGYPCAEHREPDDAQTHVVRWAEEPGVREMLMEDARQYAHAESHEATMHRPCPTCASDGNTSRLQF